VGKLASLLGIRDAVTRAARGGDRDHFADVFVSSMLYFVCVPARFAAGLPANASQDEILAQVEAAAKDLSESQGFQPFVYPDSGRRRMPIFSSDALATQFASWYALHTQRIIPLQVLGVEGSLIVPAFKDCDVVALNDRTKHEYLLTDQDASLLKRACGGGRTSA